MEEDARHACSEAAITSWCRENRSSSQTARLFFDLVDRGMPLFSSDEEAFSWLAGHAESDPSAAFILDLMHYEGLGTEMCYTDAVKWFSLAADRGSSEAQYMFGVFYSRGEWFKQSLEESARWYRLAADQGHTGAQFALGKYYEFGKGVPQSDEEALRLYRLAAEQGHAGAQLILGASYEYGKGVPQSYEEALKWYRMGADRGEAAAQCILGEFCEHGKGVQQSLDDAKRWYRLAAVQGDRNAEKALRRLEPPEDGRFLSVTMNGRMCYVMMCIERYLLALYPDRDWTVVAERMWKWPSYSCWTSEGLYSYIPVTPGCFLGYGSYEEMAADPYDGRDIGTREDYEKVKALYEGITDGRDEEELVQVLDAPIDLWRCCDGEYYDIDAGEEQTMASIAFIEGVLQRRGIEPPDASLVSCFTPLNADPERSHFGMYDFARTDCDRWGFGIDAERLSMILNRDISDRPRYPDANTRLRGAGGKRAGLRGFRRAIIAG